MPRADCGWRAITGTNKHRVTGHIRRIVAPVLRRCAERSAPWTTSKRSLDRMRPCSSALGDQLARSWQGTWCAELCLMI